MELNCCNQDKILIDTELLLMNKQIKWFSEMETATGVAEFEKIDSNFERNGSSTLAWKIPWMEEPGGLHGVAKSLTRLIDFTLKEVPLFVKCYQIASHATEESFMKGRVN